MIAKNSKNDAVDDLTVFNRLGCCNLIVTRKLTKGNTEFIRKINDNKESCILAVLCSGWGGTLFEKGIPDCKELFDGVNECIKSGFPVCQIKLVIAPVYLNNTGIEKVKNILETVSDTPIFRVQLNTIDINNELRAEFKQQFGRVPVHDDSLRISLQKLISRFNNLGIHMCLHRNCNQACFNETDLKYLGIDYKKIYKGSCHSLELRDLNKVRLDVKNSLYNFI